MCAMAKLRCSLACFFYQLEGLLMTQIGIRCIKSQFLAQFCGIDVFALKMTDFDEIGHFWEMICHDQTSNLHNVKNDAQFF